MYENGKIYVLREAINDDIFYVGSTCSTLTKRKSIHNKEFKTDSRTVFEYIRQLGGTNDCFYIELYEDFPCQRREQLLKREGEVQRELKGQGIKLKNMRLEGRTKEIANAAKREWRKNNPEKTKAIRRKNYYKDVEKSREYFKKRNATKVQCECGLTLSISSLASHRRSKCHKERMGEENATTEYTEKQKALRIKRSKEKIDCSCGKLVGKNHYSRHLKSQHHVNNTQSLKTLK